MGDLRIFQVRRTDGTVSSYERFLELRSLAAGILLVEDEASRLRDWRFVHIPTLPTTWTTLKVNSRG